MVRELRPRRALYQLLAEELRKEILSGKLRLGDQLPTENQLVENSQMSRATVRQALSILEHEGFIVTRHGAGRFVSRPDVVVSSGIEELKPTTITISEQGLRAGLRYLSKEWRGATEHEANLLGIKKGDRVLDLRREVTADGRVVALTHDVLPAHVLPEDFDLDALKKDHLLSDLLQEKSGVVIKTAHSAVHATRGKTEGLEIEGEKDPLFVVLDETFFSESGEPVMYTRTYFVEGRFNFTVVRTRPVSRGPKNPKRTAAKT
jgi:GntR family transcriptional regulator